MVLTGVEIVGVVLAVLPLLVTLLEHHKAETRPFKALLRHEKELMNAAQELGIIQSRYIVVIELIIEDLGLAPSQKSMLLKSAHRPGEASVWAHIDVEQAFIESLGEVHYKQGVLPLLEKIWKGVLDISAILGLDLMKGPLNAKVCVERIARTSFEIT